MIGQVRAEQRAWRGEMALALADGSNLPVSLRAEPVPARDGSMLGFEKGDRSLLVNLGKSEAGGTMLSLSLQTKQ